MPDDEPDSPVSPETEHPIADEPVAAEMPETSNPSSGSHACGNKEKMKGTLQRLSRLEELKVMMDEVRREIETRSIAI